MKKGACDPARFTVRGRVEILVDNPALDGLGQVDYSDAANWQTLGSFWMAAATRGGSETWDNDQVQAIGDAAFELPYSSKAARINAKSRLYAGGEQWDIMSADNVDLANVIVKLVCKRRVTP